jgi:hypothetical protein
MITAYKKIIGCDNSCCKLNCGKLKVYYGYCSYCFTQKLIHEEMTVFFKNHLVNGIENDEFVDFLDDELEVAEHQYNIHKKQIKKYEKITSKLASNIFINTFVNGGVMICVTNEKLKVCEKVCKLLDLYKIYDLIDKQKNRKICVEKDSDLTKDDIILYINNEIIMTELSWRIRAMKDLENVNNLDDLKFSSRVPMDKMKLLQAIVSDDDIMTKIDYIFTEYVVRVKSADGCNFRFDLLIVFKKSHNINPIVVEYDEYISISSTNCSGNHAQTDRSCSDIVKDTICYVNGVSLVRVNCNENICDVLKLNMTQNQSFRFYDGYVRKNMEVLDATDYNKKDTYSVYHDYEFNELYQECLDCLGSDYECKSSDDDSVEY